MRIYLKTPLVNNSKMIPHIVEHCIGHSALYDMKDFFDFTYTVDWVISSDYTYFEFDERVDYKKAIDLLCTPLKEVDFLYEQKVIQQELDDVNYDQRIYEYAVKQFLNPSISINNFEKVKRNDVKNYHSKYYVPNNMTVVDENTWKIIYKWEKAPKKESLSMKFIKSPFVFEDDEYLIYVWKSIARNHYWKLYFFFRIIDAFCCYTQRWQKQTYYYLEPYFYQYKDNCIVIIWDFDYSKLNQDFFENWKRHILNMLISKYFKERFVLNEYVYWIPKSRSQVIELCKNYSREDFQDMLSLK